MTPSETVKRIIVLGGGSAGFLAAIALKSKIPDLSVEVIRSKDIGIIGVGEGSTPTMTRFLHEYLQVGLKKFFETARPSWKLGLKFIWGKRPSFHYPFGMHLEAVPPSLSRPAGFYCGEEMYDESVFSAMMAQNRAVPRSPGGAPIFDENLAYHFENERLVKFLEGYAIAAGVVIHDDSVVEVQQSEHGVSGLKLASQRLAQADLYVDCSGFVSLLLGKTLGEPFISYKKTLACERAVVGGWDRTDEPIKPYTTCETMNSGWCWQIEHANRINRGYVYSPDFITDQAAQEEFAAQNPKIKATRIVRFVSGRYRNAWVKNVVAIGNSAGFVEPLEASSLGVICTRSRLLTNILANCGREVRDSQVALFNRENAENWDSIRDFLAVHYRFNTRLDTPFWQYCRQQTDLAGALPIVEHYQANGPDPFWAQALFSPFEAFGIAAYFALLIGQQVPYRKSRDITNAEQNAWNAKRRAFKDQAAKAMTVTEALNLINSPKWKWKPS
jgi:tryptophan halogenase